MKTVDWGSYYVSNAPRSLSEELVGLEVVVEGFDFDGWKKFELPVNGGGTLRARSFCLAARGVSGGGRSCRGALGFDQNSISSRVSPSESSFAASAASGFLALYSSFSLVLISSSSSICGFLLVGFVFSVVPSKACKDCNKTELLSTLFNARCFPDLFFDLS